MKKIQMYTKNVEFPCLKEELVNGAVKHGADDATIGILQSLPLEFFADHRALKDCIRNG
ncbi:DUF2795 domain-containing protein [Candidatus Microgenomates bacterium]|nr:DUF2795 domain-containing protein [Candidatus Microgenomates bacterium]